MLNKCQFIGNVGRLPEVTYTQGGTAIAKFSLGCSEKWTDKTSGEKREHTEWVRFVAFGKQAETIGRYVQVGQQLYIESRTKTSKYEKNGEDRYSTEFQINDFKFLGKKQDQQQAGSATGLRQGDGALQGGFNRSSNQQANHGGGFQQPNNTGNFQQQNNQQGNFQGQQDNQSF
jgi:single-strand DNA-binding protein